ncbi:protein YIPF1-like [Mizuhopecten yessoensis]|uniref:Protein YIPF n=1 Tax=Mizuhopecten yessoensis TaxID=6573 RepID=A0A210QJG4_MIZYE|nr:protein YIPF1-like [Mizuhopecten yessoensis]OWF48880.1 Protein YIPF1 [Mizuhopecten yessoensis]
MADDTSVDVDLNDDDKQGLQFHDGGYPSTKEDKKKTQTHMFTNFPHTAASDDDEENILDKSELLKDEKPPPSFWTFQYYQQFFDVETYQVLNRILGSMVPRPGSNYLKTHIQPNPDLYGPFWICTTLIFTTAIAGNLANYLQSGGKEYEWRYDFHKVTFAAAAIFSYWWLVPTGLFAFLWWRGTNAGYSFLDLLSVYGYSLAIYIPISILWVVQVDWLQWILVLVGTTLSGTVLTLIFWPVFRDGNKRTAWAVVIIIFLLHASLAVGFKLYFFNAQAGTAVGVTTSAPVISTAGLPKVLAATQQEQKAAIPAVPSKGNTPQDKTLDVPNKTKTPNIPGKEKLAVPTNQLKKLVKTKSKAASLSKKGLSTGNP